MLITTQYKNHWTIFFPIEGGPLGSTVSKPTGPRFIFSITDADFISLNEKYGKIGRTSGYARTSQRVGDTFFVRQFAVITFVISEHHVHDEAGEKDNHSRKQNRKPQGD